MNTFKESIPIGDELTAELQSEVDDGHFDTRVIINGEFWVDEV